MQLLRLRGSSRTSKNQLKFDPKKCKSTGEYEFGVLYIKYTDVDIHRAIESVLTYCPM